MINLLVLQLNTAVEGSIEEQLNKFEVIYKDFIVDADLIKERRGSNSLGQIWQDIMNIVHEQVFCFGVVEAEKGEILEDGEDQPSMDF